MKVIIINTIIFIYSTYNVLQPNRKSWKEEKLEEQNNDIRDVLKGA